MEDPSVHALRGVPMVQLAAVHAAVAEGFALGDVLAIEGLPRQVWFEAEVSWKARLVSQQDVMSAYAHALTEEQDRLQRRVDPLEDELEAWIVFLRCYGEHADPFDLLAALGLGLNDMARLGRLWAQRFDADDKLARQAAKLSLKIEGRTQRGDPLILPPITVADAALSPSSAAGTYRDEADAPDPLAAMPLSAPVLGLDQYAALSADLRVADESDRDAVLARYGIEARHAVAVDEAWRFRLESDRELRSDFRVLVGHYEQSARLRHRAAAELPKHHEVPVAPLPASPIAAFLAPLPISAPPESLRMPPPGTAAGVVMAHAAVLPFRGSVASIPRIAHRLPPPPPRRDGDIDATTDVIPALLDSEVMPFDADDGRHAPGDLDGTMMIGAISFDDDDVLPFSGQNTPPPISDLTLLPDSLPIPLIGGAGLAGAVNPLDVSGSLVISLSDADLMTFEGSLDMTSAFMAPLGDADVLPFSSVDTTASFEALVIDDAPLPFSSQPAPRAPQRPPQQPVAVAPAQPISRPTDPLDTTTVVKAFDIVSDPSAEDDIDSTTLFRAIDLGLDDEPEAPPSPHAPQAPPQAPHAPQAPPQTPPGVAPSWTFAQLASFHAELAVRPHDAPNIRRRYHLSETMQHSIEGYWRRRFATHPAELAAYHQKLAEFRAWLASK